MSATIFYEGFETGALGVNWSLSPFNSGRCSVSTNGFPAIGQWHLVLDDGQNDAVFSLSECVLGLNLANRKNVVLSFRAKSVGNEPNTPPTTNFTGMRLFDGVSISADGGTTWRSVQSLATVGTEWQSYTITLDSAVTSLGGTFNENFRIRFSAYDNAPAPVDGIAIDEVLVTADDNQRLVVEVPPTIREGTSTNTGYALIAIPSTNTTIVLLTCSIPGFVSVPAFVEIPPGQLAAPFTLTARDDGVLTTNLTGVVTGVLAGATNATASFLLMDDDVPALSLSLPSQLTEGEFPSSNAVLRAERAITVALVLNLQSQPFSQLSHPSILTLPAGQTQMVFSVSAFNDSLLDGSVPVTLSASRSGFTLATASTQVFDNETNALSFSNSVTAVTEGGQVTGYVRLLGVLPTNLVVTLATTNSEITLTTTTVTIPSGAVSAPFIVMTRDNTLQDGTRTASVTASADGFAGGAWLLNIRDNEAAALKFSTLASILNVSQPLSINLSATDINGTLLTGWSDTVELSVLLPDGTALPTIPANFTAAQGSNLTFRLPEVGAAQLRLRAVTPGGLLGISTAFDPFRVIELPTSDVIWDPGRQRLHVSSPPYNTSTNADHVVSIDPYTAQIVGRVLTGQTPGRLALTSGGENLYAALDRNASIAKINPATLTVTSTFSLGSDPMFGPFYASDLSAVAGQPDAVVVARRAPANFYSSQQHSIAVYDNGLVRPNVIPTALTGGELEPSAAANTFFTFASEYNGAFILRRLRLDVSGLTALDAVTNSLAGYASRIRADGDKVVNDAGLLMDGSQMRPLGAFPTNGVVCPDIATYRVYFLERSWYSSGTFLTAYGADTFARLLSVRLPVDIGDAVKLIRWGTNGLAIASSSRLYLLNSSQLTAPDPPADLVLSAPAPTSPHITNGPITTVVTVTNRGPNTARNVLLEAEFNRWVLSAASTNGVATMSATNATLRLAELASGGVAVMNVEIQSSPAGVATARINVRSDAADPDNANSGFSWFVSSGFAPNTNSFNTLSLTGNNLLYDATRSRLWATLPGNIAPPLGRTLVAIDPVTGVTSEFLPLAGEPVSKCMALSGNGRYLYVGLLNRFEVQRVDLNGTNHLVIPIGSSSASDLEVLDGDGTGFLVVQQYSYSVTAFDNAVKRTNIASGYTASRIERTGIPSLFLAQNGDTVRHLDVGPSGVAVGLSVANLLPSYPSAIVGSGNLLLANSGELIRSTNLTLQARLDASGTPCLDTPNRRAFVTAGTTMFAFDTVTGVRVGTLPVPGSSSYPGVPQICVRWGVDGFALLDQDGTMHIGRWPGIMPTEPDANADGIPDSWTTNHFGTASFNPAGDDDGDGIPNAWEYFFNTSPLQASASPFQTAAKDLNGQKALRLTFPRRAGIFPQPYAYEWSSNLVHWLPAQNVTESVLSLQSADGASTETVEAVLPATNSVSGFLRLKWLPR